VSVDDLVRLTERVVAAGLKAKPEVGIQFGAGGASSVEALEAEGTRDVGQAVELARRHLDAGATTVMIESEGITEQVREWRLDVVARIVAELGLEHVMFEAAEPEVFGWSQRKSAFEHLRRWLRERPDDAKAKDLRNRYEAEFGREDAETPLSRDTSGEGFGALSEAERRAR
jgi:hypothetical protein